MAQKNPLEIRKILDSKPKTGTPEFSERAFWRREMLLNKSLAKKVRGVASTPTKKPVRANFNVSGRTRDINEALRKD